MSLAVETVGLGHRYGNRSALEGLNLTVDAGEQFAMLGPNGGGKTTLFRILSTLLQPTTGAAKVFNNDVIAQQAAVRRRIGVVFQSPSLDGKLTVAENLKHAGHLYGLRGSELRSRSAQLISRFGVSDRASDRVETLSGGLARRVEVAKSLLHQPQLLLLDEPTTGLDVTARRDLQAYLRQAGDEDKVTVLLTTHILDDAESADRVAVIDAGKLLAVDTPAALKSQVGGSCLTIHAGKAVELARQVTEQLGVEATEVDGIIRIEHGEGHRFAAELVSKFGSQIRSVTVGQPTLEDVFIRLTGHHL